MKYETMMQVIKYDSSSYKLLDTHRKFWVSIHEAVRRLTAKSRELSKPPDWVLW